MVDLIGLLIAGYFVTLPVLGMLVALVLIAIGPKPITAARVYETLLRQFLLFGIGLAYVVNFIFHSFFGELAASLIGWEDSPFQFEVGVASLGFGLVGFFAISRDTAVRFAALLGPAAFVWGAAVGHIIQIVTAGNHSPGNAGFMLYADILLPFISFVLLWLAARHPLPEGQDAPDGVGGTADLRPRVSHGSPRR
ncbi:hypothetical protein MLP_42860 [Microlunatus phosphovorus NM-1]|uniref:Uncharacterized protein n=1 Tax=Microlunatus phosphovorus (strain ATCC 700054 / DSM 10555 / JCM 9379 / NBRC 101784 / NCIMB 13414 / VKM Ac-1990 / NM-1) TaxID=1032480 RepID=F5XSP2_MICPN|nr:DUF6790 family protein [Microlunatus phosphovorus]BAK37300.1 hypothetical protein MLP_42860 [Microlunatus phosphovorus NM-1]